jgi:hypothetical protein
VINCVFSIPHHGNGQHHHPQHNENKNKSSNITDNKHDGHKHEDQMHSVDGMHSGSC